MRIKQAIAVGFVAMAPVLTGCLSHTYKVPKTRPAPVVMSATQDQLLTQVETRFNQIQSLKATVEIVSAEGGARQGQVIQHPSFSGYIFLRKPQDLRVLLRLPILGSEALDMVSDGKAWKLWIPHYKKAWTGTGENPDPAEHGVEALRPSVIRDPLLVRGLGPGQVVSLTQDSRIIQNDKNKKDLIEAPEYDLEILEEPKDQTAHPVRVIHIGRSTLLPYQQDIYGPDGTVVTRAFYSNYQMFGDVSFPMKIEIRRPQDQLSLTITITQLSLNQKLEDDQLELKIPDGVPIKTMNE